MIVKMIQNLRNRMEAQIEKIQEMFKRDLEELKKNTDEWHNNWNEGINNRITEAEQQISELLDKMVEIPAEEQNKKKGWKELKTTSETSGTTLNTPIFEL